MRTMAATLPTGEQHRLVRETDGRRVEATVTELAASLRSLRVDGTPLVAEYPDDVPPPGGSGIVLVPWPNRVAGATWGLDGKELRLDVTEPSTGNASHGLLRNTGYAVADRSADHLTLTAPVFPQHGYPFVLRTSVRYALAEDGVTVTHTLVNAGTRSAPVAVGAHPYLTAGDAPAEDQTVEVDAATFFEVDHRAIPVGTRPVEGSDVDLRGRRRVDGLELDTAYTDLTAVDGRFRHRLRAPGGTAVELWAEEAFRYAQVYVNRKYVGPDGRRTTAVAVEPMTAPANALNTGTGLRWLEPAETWSVSWGIRRLA